MARTGGSPAARTLGAELREQRTRVGLSTRRLADTLDIPRTRISRWESGDYIPTVAETAHYLGGLRATSADTDRIMALRHQAAETGDWLTSTHGLHQELMTLVEHERAANIITECAPLVIPGLLQTRAYTEVMLAGVPPDERDARVELRQQRRQLLFSPTAPRFLAFIAEGALRRPFGGDDVHQEQLEYLEHLTPDIGLQVLPTDVAELHPGHMGQFILFEFPNNERPIVHLEHYAAASFLIGARPVSAYARAVETLRSQAMDPEQSRAFIGKIRKERDESA